MHGKNARPSLHHNKRSLENYVLHQVVESHPKDEFIFTDKKVHYITREMHQVF